jgi:hypothetical protein
MREERRPELTELAGSLPLADAQAAVCPECGLSYTECSAVSCARRAAEDYLRDAGYPLRDARKRALELVAHAPTPRR